MWRWLFHSPPAAPPGLDQTEREMKSLAEHFLAQPNKGGDLIDLCQKVLVLCAKREGKPAPVFDARNWQDGFVYLLSASGRKGPAQPCQFIEHDYLKVEMKGHAHLKAHVLGYGEKQQVVLVDSDGLVIVQAHVPVMNQGQVLTFKPGPLVRITTD